MHRVEEYDSEDIHSHQCGSHYANHFWLDYERNREHEWARKKDAGFVDLGEDKEFCDQLVAAEAPREDQVVEIITQAVEEEKVPINVVSILKCLLYG